MAIITLNSEKLSHNFTVLDSLFKEHGIEWAAVSKLLCGNKTFIKELLNQPLKQLCDSRVSNLKMIKSLDPSVETIYIKPPPKRSIPGVVKYADISFNTEIKTIEFLSKEAVKQEKIHKVLIMIELGELREGVLRDDLLAFYNKVFDLPNIKVIGIGTNLTCMNGVLPSHDKLIQLCLYEQLIEAKFNKNIEYVSGGSSVTVPLIEENLLPKGVNHFRVGETLFLGTNVYNNTNMSNMANDVFALYAEIIELIEKPSLPVGEFGQNLEGKVVSQKSQDQTETSYRAILDLGLLDIDQEHIKLKDDTYSIVGASSDMLVVDLGSNEKDLSVGDLVPFQMDYMGILRIMNSKYIEKKIV